MLNWRKNWFYFLPPLLVLCAVMTVTVKADLAAFMVAGENAEEVLLASEMQSGTLSRRYLISIGTQDKSKVPKAFSLQVQQQLKTIDGVVDVWSPGQQNNIPQTMHSLYAQHGSGFYSLNPEQDLAQIFTQQGLEQKAQLLKKLLLSPQGAMIKKIALQDPLLLTLNGFQSVSGQMQKVAKDDSNYRMLILETAMAGLNAPEQNRIQTEIKAIFKQLNQAQSSNYLLEMTGVPIFAAATQSLIQGDITKVSILSSVALMILFLLIFRSFSVLFQVFSLLTIVIASAILSTQLIFGYVHGMTIAIGATLIGICIDYPIHAVAHAQSVAAEQRKTVIAKIWTSMLLGGLTTMIGYVALGISGYPGFQQVAVFAVTGIIVSLLITRFVFPSLITGEQKQPLNVPLVSIWAKFCQRFRPWLISLLLIILALSFMGLKSLHWMTDMQQLTPELNYLKLNDQRIRARMTSIEPGRFVLVTGANIEQVLQKTEAVYPVLDQLKQAGTLTDYFGLYPWILSAHRQQQNQALLTGYLTPENQQRWQHALKQQGLSVKRLGQLNYPAIDALTLKQILETPVSKLIDSRVLTSGSQALAIIWLAEHQPKAVQAALQQIDGAQYFSQRDMLNNMTKDYTERAQILLSIGLGLIVLVLIVRYKSLSKAIQTLLPAILAALLILALWSYTGAAISFLHLVGFLLVVAICVDYGIFYQENRGGDIGLTYQAMAASMLTSALAFGSLITAESTSLKILASVVALGVVLGFLLCPLIINNTLKKDILFKSSRLFLWIKRFNYWIYEGKTIIVSVVLVFPAIIALNTIWCDEASIRMVGVCFQLSGMLFAIKGLLDIRTHYKLPPLRHLFSNWCKRFPKWKEDILISPAVNMSSTSEMKLRKPQVGSPDNSDDPIEKQMEKILESLEQLSVVQRKHAVSIDDLKDRDKKHKDRTLKDLEKTEKTIRLDLETLHTGGLIESLFGLVWIIIGIVLGTIPDKLVEIFGCLNSSISSSI